MAIGQESTLETLSIFHEHHLSHPKNHGTMGSQALSQQDFGNRQLVVCKHHPKALRFKSKQESNIQLLLRASLVWKWAGNVRKPVLPTRCLVLPSSSQAGSSFAHGALLTGLCLVLRQIRNHKTPTGHQFSPSQVSGINLGCSRTFFLLHPCLLQ